MGRARFCIRLFAVVAVVALVGWIGTAHAQADPLPSWNEGPTKARIVSFVKEATTPAGPRFVAPEDRIATFDQDGTLWTEHPLYTEAMFALDRLRRLAPEHPEWKQEEPFKSVLSGDRDAITKLTAQDWAKLIGVTHAGMGTAQFLGIVRDWLATARDPRFHQPYTRLVYQPMLELLAYLRANGFKTYIVTGGGQEFVRGYSQEVYGIPPEQVVGSSIATRYEMQAQGPVLMREPSIFFVDDHDGKPIGINLFIGKRPVAAFGNSAGDREMLEWTTVGTTGAPIGMLVLHDDAVREYAYGPAGGLPDTKVGTLPQTLIDEARSRDWAVVSMKKDWKRIYPWRP
jgi:hypothetical protein